MREGVSVQEASVDSKRDLEDALRAACNDFIQHTSESLGGPILQLVEDSKGSGLAQQAMLSAGNVKGTLERALNGLEDKATDVATQMALYLDNPATQSILLKPASRKVTRSVEELRKMVSEMKDGDNGWNAESRAEVEELLQSVEQIVRKTAKASR